MNFTKIFDLYKNRSSSSRQMNFSKLLGYFLKLKVGEMTKKIYLNNKKERFDLEENLVFAENMIDSHIRKTLEKIKLNNIINVKEKKGFENIGMGAVITPAMFGNLIMITQKKTSIYFSTKEKKKLNLSINFLAIPKISGQIKFEDKIIDNFTISTLTEYKKTICVNSELITNNISKVTIIVDKCWSANYLDNVLPNFPLGIAIQTMELS